MYNLPVDVDVPSIMAAASISSSALSPEQLVWPIPVGMVAPALCRSYTGMATASDQHILLLVKEGGIPYGMIAAAMAAKLSLTGMGHAGRIPTLTPLEMLTRVHLILGHAPLRTVLATLAHCASLAKNAITGEAIKQHRIQMCGICESALMRHRTFRSTIVVSSPSTRHRPP